uniref:Enoyl reductase (ER) domain-containing protein n=1 Tax=Panagrolaimus sp. JU765 TaxID=591449 RepID=A0AC34Q5Q2_9BILA
MLKKLIPSIQSSVRGYRAAVLHKYDTDIKIQDVKDKLPTDHELLIKTETAGVNHADCMMLKGKYHLQPPLPFIPGYEAIGIVESVGKKVQHWKEGDRVLVLKYDGVGTFADKVMAHEKIDVIVKVPYSIDADLAPALSVYGIAYLGMKKLITENRGNSFLVLSSRGTVGFAAIDLAQNVFEGVVFGASDSEDKLEAIRATKVDTTLNWTDGRLVSRVKEKTFNKGVDFVIDTVGGNVFDQGLQCLKIGGHILSLGFSSGDFPKVDLLDLHRVNGSLSAVWLSGLEKKEIAKALDMIAKMFDDGFLQGIKIQKYPLEDINKCFKEIQDPAFFGKAVLTMY